MSILVDQWGAPITSRKFFKASNNNDGNRPSETIRALDPLKKLLTYRDWQTISFLSSKFFANFGVFKGAIQQKSMLAVGNAWAPIFMGEDKEWGLEAKTWLIEQWYPTCDVRGWNFDFATCLYNDSVTVDREGDCIAMLTRSEQTGWPQIQRIPSRQIGQWDSWAHETKVSGGPYDGATICSGVIVNSAGRPIAYRKLGEKRGEFEDISARDIIHVFEPDWYEQHRGLPLLSASIEEFRDIAQSDEWERQAMLIASAIGILEYNETGADEDPRDPLNILDSDGEATQQEGLTIKSMLGGMVRYFKANSGAKLEQFLNNRPTEEWTQFQDRQIRKALAGANWPYSMVWKPDGTNGTVQRSELNKAKTAVADRQSLLFPAARRMVQYAVSVAIQQGILPDYPGQDKGGFLKWAFTLPPKITIDEGRDRQQRREDFKTGIINMTTIVEEDGNRTIEDHYRQRAHEIALRKQIAREVSDETGEEIEEREMMMLTPNEMSQEQIDSQQKGNKEQSTEEDE